MYQILILKKLFYKNTIALLSVLAVWINTYESSYGNNNNMETHNISHQYILFFKITFHHITKSNHDSHKFTNIQIKNEVYIINLPHKYNLINIFKIASSLWVHTLVKPLFKTKIILAEGGTMHWVKCKKTLYSSKGYIILNYPLIQTNNIFQLFLKGIIQ